MIVLDTSALLAIVWNEPEAPAFADILIESDGALISAATRLEAWTVCLNRKGPANAEAMEQALAAMGVVTAPFDEHQFLAAREAYARFRTGRRGLNFGDCFSYALAKSRALPLLYKGEDFAATDVEAATGA